MVFGLGLLLDLLENILKEGHCFLNIVFSGEEPGRRGSRRCARQVINSQVHLETLAEGILATVIHLIKLFSLGNELSPLHQFTA